MMQNFVQAILKTQSAYRQIIQRKMRENNIDLTFEMIFVMKHLAKNDNVNQQELANLAYKDKSSLSYLIKNMEKRGLITRKEDEKDKRNKLVGFTTEGKNQYLQVRQVVDDVYNSIETTVDLTGMQQCIDYMEFFTKTVKIN